MNKYGHVPLRNIQLCLDNIHIEDFFFSGGYLIVETGSAGDNIGFLMSPNISNHPSCLSFYYRVGDAVEHKLDERNILVVLVSDIRDALTGQEIWRSKVRHLRFCHVNSYFKALVCKTNISDLVESSQIS